MSIAQGESADYNTKILHPLLRWVADHRGHEAAVALAARTGVPWDGGVRTQWISKARFEAFLEEARALFPDDDAFKRASVHRLDEGYGALRFAMLATSPSGVYKLANRTYRLVTVIGDAHIVSLTRTSMHARVVGPRISRLNCLVRQMHMAQLPTLFGLPAATLRETKCVAHGDDACEYHLRYFDSRRFLPPIGGAIAGAVVAAASKRLGIDASTFTLLMPAFGGLLGFALEQRRAVRENLAVAEEQNAALRAIAREETEARRELLAMQERQREWLRFVEEDAAERAADILAVVESFKREGEARSRQVRGFSHDLASPLSVIRLGARYLSRHVRSDEAEARDVIAALEEAAESMHSVLREVTDAASAWTTPGHRPPEIVTTESLEDRLERRLRAIVYGRDVRISVRRTREAPDAVEADPLLLDRMIDTLLAHAAKQTDRGTIAIEIDGVPEFLVLKIGDTSRGLAPEQLEQSLPRTSLLVQLLAQIGGRLEVVSKPDAGTTFWVYLPRRPRSHTGEAGQVASEIVTIRPREKIGGAA